LALKNESLVNAVLDDWRTAPIDAKLRATLGFLEKLTREPEAVTADDLAPLRRESVSDAAIEEAIHVCVLFNIYDRLADSLEFQIPDQDGFKASGHHLLTRGYA
jgi:alkylhydroperoxidase family enzyme